MTRTVLAVLLLLASLPARAAVTYSVDVYPRSCGADAGSGRERWGGLLFAEDGKAYALTTDVALWSGNDPSCLSVAWGRERQASARPLATEWGTGLALLELARVPEGVELASLESVLRDPVAGSNWKAPAVVPRSDRHYLALLPEVLEVRSREWYSDLPGMPSVDRDGRIQGLFSDQYLAIVPGMPTQIFAWFSDLLSEPQVQSLIAVPSSQLLAWARAALAAGGRFVPRARLLQPGRRGGPKSVRSGEFEFTEKCQSDPFSPGGGSLGPVGGGNGVGVGGQGPGQGRCSIRVRKAAQGDTAWAFPGRPGLATTLRERLSRQPDLEIRSLTVKDPITGESLQRGLNSLEEFFKRLSQAGTEI